MAAASVTACSAPNPSAAGDGTSLVVGCNPASDAARNNPAASVLTLSTNAVTSA